MIYSEEEVDSVADQDFKCVGCRPPQKIFRPKISEKKENETIIDTQGNFWNLICYYEAQNMKQQNIV